MSKADIGKIYKEKTITNGIIYFSEMMSAMFIVLAEDSNHQIIFTKTFPFTESTKTKQKKLARNTFNTIRYKLSNSSGEGLEEN